MDPSKVKESLDAIVTQLLCVQCNEILEDCRRTTCGHWICSDCVESLFADKARSVPCPGCNHKLAKVRSFKEDTGIQSVVDLVTALLRYCHSCLRDTLTHDKNTLTHDKNTLIQDGGTETLTHGCVDQKGMDPDNRKVASSGSRLSGELSSVPVQKSTSVPVQKSTSAPVQKSMSAPVQKSTSAHRLPLAHKSKAVQKSKTAQKSVPASKPVPAQKSTPASKPALAQKSTPASKPAPAQKLVSASKPAPAQKLVSASKPAPAQNSVSVQRSISAQKPVPAQKSVPAQKPVSVQRSASAQKPAPVLWSASAKMVASAATQRTSTPKGFGSSLEGEVREREAGRKEEEEEAEEEEAKENDPNSTVPLPPTDDDDLQLAHNSVHDNQQVRNESMPSVKMRREKEVTNESMPSVKMRREKEVRNESMPSVKMRRMKGNKRVRLNSSSASSSRSQVYITSSVSKGISSPVRKGILSPISKGILSPVRKGNSFFINTSTPEMGGKMRPSLCESPVDPVERVRSGDGSGSGSSFDTTPVLGRYEEGASGEGLVEEVKGLSVRGRRTPGASSPITHYPVTGEERRSSTGAPTMKFFCHMAHCPKCDADLTALSVLAQDSGTSSTFTLRLEDNGRRMTLDPVFEESSN